MRITAIAVTMGIVIGMITGGFAGPGPQGINREKAVVIAREYIKKNRGAGLYRLNAPIVTERKDEFLVQFNMVRQNVKPGVAIVSVHRATGAARIVPVE